MGAGANNKDEKNDKKEKENNQNLNQINMDKNNEKNRRNQEETNQKLVQIDIDIFHVTKSVCKIKTDLGIGTGFLIKLFRNGKDFNCLMTNEHVIKNEMINSKKKISIFYNAQEKTNEIILNKNERFIKGYKNIGLDIRIVEILKKDSINDEYFLLPYIADYNLVNKNIYIVQFPEGNLGYSKGTLLKINNYEMEYDVHTKHGSSGSPIFLENTTKVIGIHKQGGKVEPIRNYGDFIYPIINDLDKNSEQLNYENGKYYRGKIINGKANGKGILYNEDGNIEYEGDFVDDKKEGKGILYNEEGNIEYEGDFVKDKFNGKGKYYYENGNIEYEGDFVNGKFEGKGKGYYENGKIMYEGDFVNDKFEGKGKYYDEDEDVMYEGDFKNHTFEGKGKYYYEDGKVKYEGNLINGNFEGMGKYYYENDEYYIGEFKNDLKHGKGKLYYENGKTKYDGEFINDNFDGNGILYYEDGEFYVGEFKNGFRHGNGILYYENGNIKYEGSLINGKFEGKGKYYYEDGNLMYEGDFSKDNSEGKGKYYKENGNILYEGDVINGEAHGKGIWHYENGCYIGEFKNGFRHGKGILYGINGNIIYDGQFIDGDPKINDNFNYNQNTNLGLNGQQNYQLLNMNSINLNNLIQNNHNFINNNLNSGIFNNNSNLNYNFFNNNNNMNNNPNNNLINNNKIKSMNLFSNTNLSQGNLYKLKMEFLNPPLRGLKNLQKNRFINPILQCLLNIEKLIEYFKYNNFVENVIYTKFANGQSLTKSFKILIENLWPTLGNTFLDNINTISNYNNIYFSPVHFITTISSMKSISQLNDANDLLSFILNKLHEELNMKQKNFHQIFNNNNNIIQIQSDVKLAYIRFLNNYKNENKSIISELFNGVIYNLIKCSNCGLYKHNFEPYFIQCFSLIEVINYKLNKLMNQNNMMINNPIMNNNNNQIYQQMMIKINLLKNNYINIYDCFDYIQKVGTLYNAKCDFCKNQSPAIYNNYLYTAPEILVIVLNREINSQIKLAFYGEIDLTNYVQFRTDNKKVIYNLISVINYMGSNSINDFRAICKNPINNIWYQYNNDLISPVQDFKNVLDEVNSFVLFYQKKE